MRDDPYLQGWLLFTIGWSLILPMLGPIAGTWMFWPHISLFAGGAAGYLAARVHRAVEARLNPAGSVAVSIAVALPLGLIVAAGLLALRLWGLDYSEIAERAGLF